MTYSSSKASVVAAAVEAGAKVDHMVRFSLLCLTCFDIVLFVFLSIYREVSIANTAHSTLFF